MAQARERAMAEDAMDVARMGAGTLVGHLMECGMQVTGGYFADHSVPPGVSLSSIPSSASCCRIASALEKSLVFLA